MKGSIAIQILPSVNREDIFSNVDEVIEFIDSTGLVYNVGPFETTIEGEFNELMEVIKKCHEIILDKGIDVNAYIKTSFRKTEEPWSIDDKIKKYNK